MFYINLLASIISLQTLAITNIITSSLLANLVTGYQYRGFYETIRHALMYHTPEANCKPEVYLADDKDLNGL